VQHGANEDLGRGQLAAVKAVVGQTGGQGKAPPPPRRPDDRGERDEVLRQDMARPVRFPGMVEPACGAWCFLRAAQEQCVVERQQQSCGTKLSRTMRQSAWTMSSQEKPPVSIMRK
jgi:hypothetical protein